MPTVFSHPAPALCLGLALGRQTVPWRLLIAGVACSVLPDLDVIGFAYGVSYGDALGHRGLSHSLLLAFGTGLLAWLAAPLLRARRGAAFFVCGGTALTHILLDAMTTGGLGVAFFWPWSEARFFLPWRPIAVSPFSLERLFSERGMRVFLSEWYWIWLPSLAGAACILLCRAISAVLKKRPHRPPATF